MQPVQHVMQRATDYYQAHTVSKIITMIPCVITMVGWRPPMEGWMKLNTHRACKYERQAGCGLVVLQNI
jgi:hypothetical protein